MMRIILSRLRPFRTGTEIINSDPTERMDGDETTWVFDPASGLKLRKIYADNSSVVKTYDGFNRLTTVTDARGNVKTHSYEVARGLQLGTVYSDGTTARQYAYNHLGQLTQVTDDAGTRTIGYNAYGEQETDSLMEGNITHLLTETRDSMGRSTGFTYAKNGEVQHIVTTGYDTNGRISTAGFMHGGAEKQFSYGYLPGSNLLQTLTMPCNMTLTQSYEAQRDLLIGMAYHRSSTLVSQRTYSYDALGRPLTRSTARNGSTVNDSFVHNFRSELTSATVNGATYGYDYDNIGNRRMALEANDYTLYETNNLNQYTSIQENEGTAFAPTFDADGNQTLVKTTTGIWSVQYNAENRPIRFTSADGSTAIECSYDSMGRRATKKVTVNGSISLFQLYIYRGYLQIAACDLTRTNHPCLWLLTWDPTQPIATRPLSIRKDGTWYAYGWDLTNNVCEVFGPAGYIRSSYSYTPYGKVTINGDVEQPIQWSSEYLDSETNLVYYNYRFYNPMDARWIRRDPFTESASLNLLTYCNNTPIKGSDVLGRIIFGKDLKIDVSDDDELKPEDGFIKPKGETWDDLMDQIDSEVNCFQCIENLVIIAHGCDVYSEITDSGDTISPLNAADIIKGLVRQETFCSKCTIYWLSCNTGFSTFLEDVAVESKCTVIAPRGEITVTKDAPWGSEVFESEDYEDSEENTYTHYYPDGTKSDTAL